MYLVCLVSCVLSREATSGLYYVYTSFSPKQNEFVCIVGALEVSPLPRS